MVKEKILGRKELVTELEAVTNELMGTLMTFDQQTINTVPYAGSWTAAQVAEHLFKSDSAILKALYGPVKGTGRAPDEYVDQINQAFLDFTTKMRSPDIIVPAQMDHEKEALISALQSTRKMMKKAFNTLELSVICTDPEMSRLVGEWTRLEYFNFVISHTKRHVYQLKKIHREVENNDVQ